jgi:hypothetical protein
LRFALASPLVILTGWLHARFFPAAFRPFAPVYGAVGLLYTNLALWILSLFQKSTWWRCEACGDNL